MVFHLHFILCLSWLSLHSKLLTFNPIQPQPQRKNNCTMWVYANTSRFLPCIFSSSIYFHLQPPVSEVLAERPSLFPCLFWATFTWILDSTTILRYTWLCSPEGWPKENDDPHALRCGFSSFLALLCKPKNSAEVLFHEGSLSHFFRLHPTCFSLTAVSNNSYGRISLHVTLHLLVPVISQLPLEFSSLLSRGFSVVVYFGAINSLPSRSFSSCHHRTQLKLTIPLFYIFLLPPLFGWSRKWLLI